MLDNTAEKKNGRDNFSLFYVYQRNRVCLLAHKPVPDQIFPRLLAVMFFSTAVS
jgi:hypothetical protein